MKVKLDPGAFMPERAHETDAGYDLRMPEGKRVAIHARDSATIDTGVHMAIPEGYCGLLVSKSGLNVKHGITNTGLIDAGYTGSIRVKLYNNGYYPYIVNPGDKISQIVIVSCFTPELEQTETMDETERGENGFGSTGR